MYNPWFVAIAGGLVAALIVRAISRPPSTYAIDLLIALGLFGIAQVGISVLRTEAGMRYFAENYGEWSFWVLWESVAIVGISLIIEAKQKNAR